MIDIDATHNETPYQPNDKPFIQILRSSPLFAITFFAALCVPSGLLLAISLCVLRMLRSIGSPVVGVANTPSLLGTSLVLSIVWILPGCLLPPILAYLLALSGRTVQLVRTLGYNIECGEADHTEPFLHKGSRRMQRQLPSQMFLSLRYEARHSPSHYQ